VMTSLSQLMVEELEADWTKARRVFAPADTKLYGPLQGVFGSLSIRTQYMPLRRAAASAKEMLIEAALASGASISLNCARRTTLWSIPPTIKA